MKKYVKFILFLAFFTLTTFFSSKYLGFFNPSEKKIYTKAHSGDYKFRVSESKPFVVVIASYNNEKIVERNLRSIFEQKYPNYRVIYIDDCSTDQTYQAAKDFIEAWKMEDKVTLIRNVKNYGAMENSYRAIRTCKDHEIVVVLDGDDWLAHDWVLERLNACYDNPDVWMTYGSYRYYPSYEKEGNQQVLPWKVRNENSVRPFAQKNGMIFSHVKTFYAGLFKRIQLQDLLYEGRFMASSWDAAAMIPMVEMAGGHAHFIKDVLYIYNRATPLNDDKVHLDIQRACWNYVLSLPPYQPLKESPIALSRKAQPSKADLVVFSYDRPMQLYACLESIERYANNVHQISVLYRCSDQEYEEGYRVVQNNFPAVTYVKQTESSSEDFKPLLLHTIFDNLSESEYVAFVKDDMIVKNDIDFKECIEVMRNVGAYGFFLHLGKNIEFSYANNALQEIPQSIPLEKNIYAWQINKSKGDWKRPNSLDMTLFNKERIRKELKDLVYDNPVGLQEVWAINPSKVGLYYEQSKVVNLPLNLVHHSNHRYMASGHTAKELLLNFKLGWKIDISPLKQIQNKSAGIEYEPTFVHRESIDRFLITDKR